MQNYISSYWRGLGCFSLPRPNCFLRCLFFSENVFVSLSCGGFSSSLRMMKFLIGSDLSCVQRDEEGNCRSESFLQNWIAPILPLLVRPAPHGPALEWSVFKAIACSCRCRSLMARYGWLPYRPEGAHVVMDFYLHLIELDEICKLKAIKRQ